MNTETVTIRNVIWETLKGSTNVSWLENAEQVIKEAECDYTVATAHAIAKIPIGVQLEDHKDFIHKRIPNRVATYRTDNNIVFDVVSENRYTIVQNKDAFDFFDKLVADGLAIYHRAGSLDNGKEVYIIAKWYQTITVGQSDEIHSYVLLTASHDGKASINIRMIPTRISCANQLTGILSSQSISIRHSSTAEAKLANADRVMKLFNHGFEQMAILYNKMFSKKINFDDFLNILYEMYLTFDEISLLDDGTPLEKAVSTRKLNIINEIISYYKYHPTQQGIQDTYWGVYNAVTGYYQNVKDFNDSQKRFKSVMKGDIHTKIQWLFNYLKKNL